MLPATLLERNKEGRKHRQKVGEKGRRRGGGCCGLDVCVRGGGVWVRAAGKKEVWGWMGEGSLVGREEVGSGG